MTHTNDELSKLRTANAELRRRLRKALDERDTMHDTLTRAQARGTELLTRARAAEGCVKKLRAEVDMYETAFAEGRLKYCTGDKPRTKGCVG